MAADVIRDVMSDITEEYDLVRGQSASEELILLDSQNEEEQKSEEGQATARHLGTANAGHADCSPATPGKRSSTNPFDSPADDEEEKEERPTLLSPFSSKARRINNSNNNEAETTSNTHPAWQLSLRASRPVSIVVVVRDPPNQQSNSKNETTNRPRIPCVFPPTLAIEGKLSLDENDHAAGNDDNPTQPASPTTAALSVVKQTYDLVILNPTAFGPALPHHVNLDILNRLAAMATSMASNDDTTGLSSEDWVRLYRFTGVWWGPAGLGLGATHVAAAVAHDVTAPGSVAQRVIVGKDISRTLWGSIVHTSVAQAFGQQPSEDSNQRLKTYGLLGETLYQITRPGRIPTTSQLTLSILQIQPSANSAREFLQDLLQTKVPPTGSTALELQHVHDAVRAVGLTEVPVDPHNLKAVGHLLRRAWTTARKYGSDSTVQGQPPLRGHWIATLRYYPDVQLVGTVLAPAAVTFVDVAPLFVEDTNLPRRDASVRQTLSVLGSVLRGTLLKASGSPVAIPYREALLTKILQGCMDHPDSRTVFLSGISPLRQDYDRTMASLRYCSRILERPGEAPKSPFDGASGAWSRGNTSPTSQMSRSTTASEQHRRKQRQIMMEQFDPKYYSTLLRNVTADPRQRFSRAQAQDTSPTSLKSPHRIQVLATHTEDGDNNDVEVYIPPNYMDIDPGAPPPEPVYDHVPAEGEDFANTTDPLGVNTSLPLEYSIERGSMEDGRESRLEPSPVATHTGGTDFDTFPRAFSDGPTDEAEEVQLGQNRLGQSFSNDILLNQTDGGSLDAEMEALSLELRRGGPAREDRGSPSDSLMDKLSQELLHNGETEKLAADQLYTAQESPIKGPNVMDAKQRNSARSYPNEEPYHSDGLHQRYPYDGAMERQPSYEGPLRVDSSLTSPQNSHDVDLSMYKVTPRATNGLPSNIVVDSERAVDVQSTSSSFHSVHDHTRVQSGRNDVTNQGYSTQHYFPLVDNSRYLGFGKPRRNLDPPSQLLHPFTSEASLPGDVTETQAEQATSSQADSEKSGTPKESLGQNGSFTERSFQDAVMDHKEDPSHSSRRADSRYSLPSDESQTQIELGHMDYLLKNVQEKSKSRTKSISGDLKTIQENHKRVIRRLIGERDSARRDLEDLTNEQRRDSVRREQEVRDLQQKLQSLYAERSEFEQIAEEAVSGREGLERRTLELEKALRKKREESVSLSDYLLLRDELETMKQLLEEKSKRSEKLKTDLSEQTTAVSRLQMELQDLEHEKRGLDSRLQQEKSTADRVQEMNGKIQVELDSLRSQVAVLENEKQVFESQLKNTKQSLQLRLEQKDGFTQSLNAQLEQLQIKLHESENCLWEQEETASRLRNQLSAANAKIEKLELIIQDLEADVEQMKASKDEIATELSARLDDTKLLTEELVRVAKERETAESRLSELEKLKNEAEEKRKLIETETATFKEEAQKRIQSFFERHQENEEARKAQEQKVEKLGNEKSKLEELLAGAKQNNETSAATIKELRSKLDQLTKSRSTLAEHEQLELQSLRKSKSDLLTELKQLREQLSDMEHELRHNADKEREVRRRAETELQSRYNSQLEQVVHERNLTERTLKNQMEEKLAKAKSEATENMRRELDKVRRLAAEEAEASAQLSLEEQRLEIQNEFKLRLQREIEREREGLQMKLEDGLQKRLNDERRKLRMESEKLLQTRLEEERRRLKEEADATLRAKLKIGLEKLQIEAENSVAEMVTAERERLRAEAMGSLQSQVASEIERFRSEFEEEIRKKLAVERTKIQTEAKMEARRELDAEFEALVDQKDREAQRQLEQERYRARIEAKRDARRPLQEELERLRAEREHYTRLYVDEAREKARLDAERAADERIREDRELRLVEAERLARVREEEERAKLREERDRASRGRQRFDTDSMDRRRDPILDDYSLPPARSGYLVEKRLSVGKEEYLRLEEITVALAQALRGQTRSHEQDIAELLRQFHAAEDAIVAQNRYFRTRIEGLQHKTSKF